MVGSCTADFLFADLGTTNARSAKLIAHTLSGTVWVGTHNAAQAASTVMSFCCYMECKLSKMLPMLRVAFPFSLLFCSTTSYLLAPGMVEPRRATKAAALMALVHQASHIVGLALATALALWMFGDISGDLG